MRKGLAAVAALFCVAVAVPARADMDAIAHDAVERDLKDRQGSRITVYFGTTNVRDLRGNERLVTGDGYYVHDDRSDRHYFDYRLKLEYGTTRTWDLSIHFKGRDDNDHRRTTSFELREPRYDDRLGDRAVRFSGYADSGRIYIEIFDRKGDRVSSEHFSVRDGRWSGSMSLPNGRLRAVAHLEGSDRTTTVWFNVVDEHRYRDRADRSFRIDGPSNRDVFRESSIDVYGRSDMDEVRIYVYNMDGRRILTNTVRVRDGRWRLTVRFNSGDYRVVAESVGATGRDEVRFTIR